MALQIEQFMCRSDNFGVLLHDTESKATAAIDAPEEQPILDALERTGWNLTHLLITHHHGDHTEAIKPLKHRFTPKVVGPKSEASKIDGLDETLGDGDSFSFGGHEVRVIETPGHTAGHICFFIASNGENRPLLFAADTLFALGCGRLFEGTGADMQSSFDKLAELPDETEVYCGHEYTQANARFALTVDPDNEALKERAGRIDDLRANGRMTLPTTLGDEKATNPYFRTRDDALKSAIGMADASGEEVFAELRRRKDSF